MLLGTFAALLLAPPILAPCVMAAGRRIAYGGDSARQYVELHGSSAGSGPHPLLIFLHGGAWYSGSTGDHEDLADYISRHSNVAVALIEYRLTKENNGVYHPDHINDVYQALDLLFQEKTASQGNYDRSKIVFAGHSAGGYMVNAAALASETGQAKFPGPVRGMPALNLHVRRAIRAFVAVESIFSIAGLVQMYPDYQSFVVPAFYPPDQQVSTPYKGLEKAGVEAWPVAAAGSYSSGDQPRMHIIHSREDDLLSSEYNAQGLEILQQKGLQPVVDLNTFKGLHDELLHTTAFWQRLIQITHDETGS